MRGRFSRYKYYHGPRIWIEHVDSEGRLCRASFLLSPSPRTRGDEEEVLRAGRGWRIIISTSHSPRRLRLFFTRDAEEEDLEEGIHAYAALRGWRIRRWWTGNAYGEPAPWRI